MIKETNGCIVITGQRDVEAVRMLALKGALKLETLGLRHSRANIAQIVRGILGVKTRNKRDLLAQFEQYLVNRGILVPA